MKNWIRRGGWIVARPRDQYVGAGVPVAVLPTVGRGIGLSELQTGMVLGLGALLGMFAAPLWGFASERFGRRPVLLATMVGVAVSPLAWAIALGGLAAVLPILATFIMLLAARCLQAGFGAGLIPTAQAYFADVTTADRRAAGMGIMSGSISLGSVVGSALVWMVAGSGPSMALRPLPSPPRVRPRAHATAGAADASRRRDARAHRIPFATVWPYFLITVLGMTAYGCSSRSPPFASSTSSASPRPPPSGRRARC